MTPEEFDKQIKIAYENGRKEAQEELMKYRRTIPAFDTIMDVIDLEKWRKEVAKSNNN
jgi:hypothetical protein